MFPELKVIEVRKMIQEMDIYGLISIDKEDRDWERTPPRLVRFRLGGDNLSKKVNLMLI